MIPRASSDAIRSVSYGDVSEEEAQVLAQIVGGLCLKRINARDALTEMLESIPKVMSVAVWRCVTVIDGRLSSIYIDRGLGKDEEVGYWYLLCNDRNLLCRKAVKDGTKSTTKVAGNKVLTKGIEKGLKKAPGLKLTSVLGFGVDVVYNFFKWCRGTITSDRLCENVKDTTLSHGAGYVGYLAAASVTTIGWVPLLCSLGISCAATYLLGSKGLTTSEKKKKLEEIKTKITPLFDLLFLEFDESLSYEQVRECLEKKHLPASMPKQYDNLRFSDVRELMGGVQVYQLLRALSKYPTRIEGLRALRDKICALNS